MYNKFVFFDIPALVTREGHLSRWGSIVRADMPIQLCKTKNQYMLTSAKSRYCLLPLQSSIALVLVIRARCWWSKHNTSINVDLMLVHRLRRRPNINAILNKHWYCCQLSEDRWHVISHLECLVSLIKCRVSIFQ